MGSILGLEFHKNSCPEGFFCGIIPGCEQGHSSFVLGFPKFHGIVLTAADLEEKCGKVQEEGEYPWNFLLGAPKMGMEKFFPTFPGLEHPWWTLALLLSLSIF